jgi:hypothetical protein
MFPPRLLPILILTLLSPAGSVAECIPFDQAGKHVGETQCVSGKVFRVQSGSRGVHYLDFCEDFRACPFTVVIFPHNLKSVGDIRQLQGRIVEVHGPIKEYDGRAEIILQESRQLGGEAARIPALPKNYDVEQRGHYSAGSISHPRTAKKKSKKRVPATLPIEVPEDESAPGTDVSEEPGIPH